MFPKLRSVVSANEFDAMAEDFERERRRFDQDGFEAMVDAPRASSARPASTTSHA